MTPEGPSLIAVVVRRIVFFSMIAMVVQFIGVVVEYWTDDQQLGHQAIEMETAALSRGIMWRNGQQGFEFPANLRKRYEHGDRGYFVRVRTENDAILFSNCNTECTERFLPARHGPLGFWMMQIQPGKPLNVAGGRVFDKAEAPILIEVAIIGDKEGVLNSVLAHEVVDHMVLPMGVMLIVVLGATTISIGRAFKPVRQAASLVPGLDPLGPSRLPIAAMPSEIAKFAQAVNVAFDRVGELLRAQKLFTSAISHEVRTPLAVARLELEKIADPRARRVEAELEALNQLVEQLTTLARLEGANLAPTESIDPDDIAQSVISGLAPLVYESGKTIELLDKGATPFNGYPALIENALRNLIENATRHTGPGTRITVEIGPGSKFCIRDNGKSSKSSGNLEASQKFFQTPRLGLKIVRRIVEIHGGSFYFEGFPGEGMTARMMFATGDSGGK
jgi:signal transduction histidine kinase